MSPSTVAILVAIVLLAGYAVLIYNALVRLKHGVGKAWSNIDVLLRQRHDELPKLVETCRQYMQHERATLEAVVAARSAVASAREQGDIGALGRAESGLRAGLGQLFAVAENYPQLKSDANFRALMDELAGTENRLSVERKRYNDRVLEYNQTRRRFPSNVTAAIFGFKEYPYFEAPESAKTVPKVDFGKGK